ncbi:hypothetical protein C8R44DRAFT_839134 [Mycena epipterygia]|nr:hypothetical protein C8R44DRAFT_839134 [Mycena epipterygia]
MESLPPELHALILDVGCGSYPGAYIPRTLSLTSTYFRDVAAPFLFHTVAISCEKQATQLLALLETAPAHQRRIRRLFLGPALTSSTVLLLLYFAAPTLRDLAVTAAPALLGALFRTHLPHLRALSVRGFYPLPRPGAFPALTHLHLAGNPSPSGLPAALARAYPALTHLRISGLRGAPAFARELRAVLEEDERLEHVVLEAQAKLKVTRTDLCQRLQLTSSTSS